MFCLTTVVGEPVWTRILGFEFTGAVNSLAAGFVGKFDGKEHPFQKYGVNFAKILVATGRSINVTNVPHRLNPFDTINLMP